MPIVSQIVRLRWITWNFLVSRCSFCRGLCCCMICSCFTTCRVEHLVTFWVISANSNCTVCTFKETPGRRKETPLKKQHWFDLIDFPIALHRFRFLQCSIEHFIVTFCVTVSNCTICNFWENTWHKNTGCVLWKPQWVYFRRLYWFNFIDFIHTMKYWVPDYITFLSSGNECLRIGLSDGLFVCQKIQCL